MTISTNLIVTAINVTVSSANRNNNNLIISNNKTSQPTSTPLTNI